MTQARLHTLYREILKDPSVFVLFFYLHSFGCCVFGGRSLLRECMYAFCSCRVVVYLPSPGVLLRDGAAELSAERVGLSAVGAREDCERRGEGKGTRRGERCVVCMHRASWGCGYQQTERVCGRSPLSRW